MHTNVMPPEIQAETWQWPGKTIYKERAEREISKYKREKERTLLIDMVWMGHLEGKKIKEASQGYNLSL